MEHFDSITDALREVKRKAQDFDEMYEKVYLFIDYWKENFYVTDDEYDISEKMEQTFYENGCEPEPETLAKECVIIEYSLAMNKKEYPTLYRKSKKPKFKSKVDLIRREIEAVPEYSLSFNIG